MRARAAYARQAELLRDGVELSGTNITYTFTGLNGLKPPMIAEATRNARQSAEQFARDSGTSVGRIKTASQGYFSVGARDGEDCDDCGSSGGSSPFQKVRVVTTIDYDLGCGLGGGFAAAASDFTVGVTPSISTALAAALPIGPFGSFPAARIQ